MTDIQLYQGDCLELMKRLPDASVDTIIVDLPYGTTQNKWDAVIPFAPMWTEYERVCKGAMVFTACQPFTSAIVMSNPLKFKYDWTWKKSRITGVLNAKRQPVRNHENILVFGNTATYNPQGLIPHGKVTKQGGNSNNYGKRKTEDYVQEFTNYPRSVLEIPSEGSNLHPTQKPLALMDYLIRTYSNPGHTILDNCMGSGTTGVAAIRCGRKFIGMEMEDKYFGLAEERIRSETPLLAI
jgi:site-specific DNA-methyltransferase (adenine-specific)